VPRRWTARWSRRWTGHASAQAPARGGFGAFLRAGLLAGAASLLAVNVFEPHGAEDVAALFTAVFAAVFVLVAGGWWALRGSRHRLDATEAAAPRRSAPFWGCFAAFATVLGAYLAGVIATHAGDSPFRHDRPANWILITIPLWLAASFLGGTVWRRFGAGAASVLLLVFMGAGWAIAEGADPKPFPSDAFGRPLRPSIARPFPVERIPRDR
jgi:hypothetical protein